MRQLHGRVALVSGGGRGVGRAIAQRFAADGAAVAINYRRDEDAAADTVAEIERAGGRAMAFQASVDEVEQVEHMAAMVRETLGPVDILISNAGVASSGRPVADTPLDEFVRMHAVHAMAPIHLFQAFVDDLRAAERSDVVIISSSTVDHPAPGTAPYVMAKAAAEILARCLTLEEREHGMRVNVVAPGLVATDMGDRAARAHRGTGTATQLDAEYPFGRVCTPDDVAGVVSLLCSHDASYVSGGRVRVDGGGPLTPLI